MEQGKSGVKRLEIWGKCWSFFYFCFWCVAFDTRW